MEIARSWTEIAAGLDQVAEIVPLLKDFGWRWTCTASGWRLHPIYDAEADKLHDPLTKIDRGNRSVPQDAGPDLLRAEVPGCNGAAAFARLVNARIYGTGLRGRGFSGDGQIA